MTFSRRGFVAGTIALSLGAERALAARAGSPDDLCELSATALAAQIRGKHVSCVEVIQAHLSRIAAVNDRINAVVALRAEAALEEARRADADVARGKLLGPLHGVPMTIKDSFDVAGMISTAGTEGRRAFIPTTSATIAERVLRAGAIVVGKSNTPELTLSFETQNTIYGLTRNPHDLSRSAGGSSGGAAAIVAACGVPADIGSDTAGSVRVPAHFCGVAALKPTAGRVPRTGHIVDFRGPLQSLTQIGPITRHVEDLGLLLDIIAGADGIDPWTLPAHLADPGAVDLKGMRVAYYEDNGIAKPTQQIAQTVRSAARALEAAGANVVEARPAGVEESFELYLALSFADGGAWIERLLDEAGTKESHLRPLLGKGALSAGAFSTLVSRWDLFRSHLLRTWRNHDVLICPTAAIAAPSTNHRENNLRPEFSYTMTGNLTGWPGAVVRCGTSSEGLPIGVQILAPAWCERRCLTVAAHLERALGGYAPPKGLPM